MRFIKLERLINLQEGYQRCFNVEGLSLLLIHTQNRNHLFLNQCPHQKKPLGNQCLQENRLRCPWHGLQYDLVSGNCLTKEYHHLKLVKYQLAYEENFIGIYLA